SRISCRRFPCEAGEAPPKGVKGALLILPWSFKIKIRIKIKSLPPSAFGTFPRFAGEGKAVVAASHETGASDLHQSPPHPQPECASRHTPRHTRPDHASDSGESPCSSAASSAARWALSPA